MKMTLSALFDFQHFAQNKELEELINETERKYGSRELSDDDLDVLWAAGDMDALNKKKENDEEDTNQ